MIVQLKQLFNIVGEKKDISYEISKEELSSYEAYTFITPITVKGSIVNRAGIISLDYSLAFIMQHTCDRCLCEFEREYENKFTHILVRSLNTDNDDYIVCDNETLDLNELAISDLLLQLPTKILCSENCRGLCSKCGQDLNSGDCPCSQAK